MSEPRSDSPVAEIQEGVRLAVRLTPKASRDRVQGLAEEPDGGVVLKIAVTAVPEAGKANSAMIRLLAKTLRLPKSAFSVAAGATERRKTLHIAGQPATLRRHIEEWIARNA